MAVELNGIGEASSCCIECLQGSSFQVMRVEATALHILQDLSLCSKGKGGGKGKKGKGKHMWKGCRFHAATQSQEEPASAAPAATEQSPTQSVEARVETRSIRSHESSRIVTNPRFHRCGTLLYALPLLDPKA